jgi:hypothetical protein
MTLLATDRSDTRYKCFTRLLNSFLELRMFRAFSYSPRDALFSLVETRIRLEYGSSRSDGTSSFTSLTLTRPRVHIPPFDRGHARCDALQREHAYNIRGVHAAISIFRTSSSREFRRTTLVLLSVFGTHRSPRVSGHIWPSSMQRGHPSLYCFSRVESDRLLR